MGTDTGAGSEMRAGEGSEGRVLPGAASEAAPGNGALPMVGLVIGLVLASAVAVTAVVRNLGAPASAGGTARADPTIAGTPAQQPLDPNSIVVKGDHTLATLAAEVKDPDALRWDPVTRVAVCNRSLRITGRLRLGEPGKPESAETLQMHTEACGALDVRVEKGGELVMHHSTLTTVAQVIAGGACPQGYALAVSGTLTARDSNIDYMSGSLSDSLMPGSRADIRNCSISRGDGHCLKMRDPEAGAIVIDGCTLAVNSGFALHVVGEADRPASARPFAIRNCAFNSNTGPVTITGRPVGLDLIDCRFGGKTSVSFNSVGGGAAVRFRWSVGVTVRKAGNPVAGAEVVATPISATAGGPAGEPAESAVTDAEGKAVLVLTEWTATPKHPSKGAGGAAGPWRITVKSGGTAMAERECSPKGLGRTEVFDLP